MNQNKEYYNIYLDNDLIASKMPLQFALIFTKAIYVEYYAEPNLKVTFERVFEEETKPTEAEVVE